MAQRARRPGRRPPVDNPWGTDAARIPYGAGQIIAAPGTDPAHLARILDDEEEQERAWSALGAELAALGPRHVRLAMLVARVLTGRGVSAEEESQLGAWLADIVGTVITRTGGVSGAIAWLAGIALRERREVAA